MRENIQEKKVPTGKWSRDYHGFESIIDFDGDMHIEDALEAIVPNSEWLGTIRVTFEYIPSQEECNGKTSSQ